MQMEAKSPSFLTAQKETMDMGSVWYEEQRMGLHSLYEIVQINWGGQAGKLRTSPSSLRSPGSLAPIAAASEPPGPSPSPAYMHGQGQASASRL